MRSRSSLFDSGAGLVTPNPEAEQKDGILPPVVSNDLVTITPVLLLPEGQDVSSENELQKLAETARLEAGSSEALQTPKKTRQGNGPQW